jgi:hypothetical protein
LASAVESECAALLQNFDNAKIYDGLYSGFQPFDFNKNPVTMGEEIEAFIPMTLELKSEHILPEVNIERGDQARIFVAEEAGRYLRTHLQESSGEEFLEEEFGNVRSYLKYLAEPIKGRFWLHPAFDLFKMTYDAKDTAAVKTISIVQDSSLSEMPGWTGVEITSPIRMSLRDDEIFDDLIEHLEVAAELKAWPEHRAGFHIHIGTPKLKPEEAALMLLAFAKVEKEFREYVGIHKSRDAFSRKIPREEIENYLRARYPKRGPILDDLMSLVKTRDRSLNIYSLESYGTVEFRLFDTTLNKEKRQWYRKNLLFANLLCATKTKTQFRFRKCFRL